MITKTLEQRLWEGCGWNERPTEHSFRTIDWPDYVWHDPSGEAHPDTGLPPITLENLFKWAIPTPQFPSFKLSYEYYLSGYTYIAKVCAKSGIWRTAYHKTDPAQALALAIMRCFDDKTSG